VPHRDRGIEQALATESVAAAAVHAGSEIDPLEDAFGSTQYRLHLARALAEQALHDLQR
jgi:CO/xanthine dehydrogenase FAD-binding subunit